MKRMILAVVGSVVLAASGSLLGQNAGVGAEPAAGAVGGAVGGGGGAVAEKRPVVQIALLLDTSNSMDGLIAQAKTQLWRIVNEFAKASADGKKPALEVALYQYGTPSLGADNGYIRQVVGLTDDLDKISEELFNLKTNGGQEYCGWVIKDAVEELKWSGEKGAYKAIFIAGNEPFTQGKVKYQESCKAAATKGIMVNTIFCGAILEGERSQWKDGAMLADGAYMAIDQNKAVAEIAAPQDKELAELGAKINTTYVRYGKAGEAGAARQMAQDANAAAAGSSAPVQRAAAKASGLYQNSTWDLVDAAKEGKKLEELKAEDLPEEMKKMTVEERKKFVETKAQERGEIQKRIGELNREREAYIAKEQAKAAGVSGEKTLDAALLDAVHQQAGKAGMKFEK